MELLALNDIARRTGIPAPTARRYASLFKEFLPGRRLGRATRYTEAAVPVFERIAHLYGEGRITTEIEEILRSEFPRTIEVGPAAEQVPLPALAQELPPQMGELLTKALSDALASALDASLSRFGDTLDALAEQKTSLDTHQGDITKLKDGFVLVARNLKRLAKRDQAELTAITDRFAQRLASSDAKLTVVEDITLTLTSDVGDLKARIAAQEVEIRRLREDRDRLEAIVRHLSGLPE